MIKFSNLICVIFIIFIFASCAGDDEEGVNPDEQSETVLLSDLSRGEGKVAISEHETFVVDAIAVGSNLSATINGNSYEVYRLSITSTFDDPNDQRSVALSFYIPVSEGRLSPPNGTFTATTEGAALDETYVEIFVTGKDDAYNSFSNTVGTVTVSNSAEAETFPYRFDVEFDVENIKSFDDLVVDAQGAFKWGL